MDDYGMKLTDKQIRVVGLLLNTGRYLWVAPVTLPYEIAARAAETAARNNQK